MTGPSTYLDDGQEVDLTDPRSVAEYTKFKQQEY